MRIPLLCSLLLVSACAPSAQPSEAQAREALAARLESSGARKVKVVQIHSLELADCQAGAADVVCSVAMDVSLDVDGAAVRSSDTGPMRFTREGDAWKAGPVASNPLDASAR